MAKDITIRVTGRNPDGTINVQPVDSGNPFAQQSSQMVPFNPSAGGVATQQQQAGGYLARIGNAEVRFATEADFLKADRAWRDMQEQQNVPSVGGSSSRFITGANGMSWLKTGAHAAETLAGFLHSRQIRRKLDDLDVALGDAKDARAELDVLEKSGKYPDLIPILRRAFIAERDATETGNSLLEDQLTAVDIQTGAGVAKVVSDFMDNTGPPRAEGGGLGTAVALGGAGLGLGLLLSNSREDDRTRRRRR